MFDNDTEQPLAIRLATDMDKHLALHVQINEVCCQPTAPRLAINMDKLLALQVQISVACCQSKSSQQHLR